MRNRKYLIGATLGVIAALAFSGIASARPIGHVVTANVAPKKQDKKKFGGAKATLSFVSQYDSFVTSQSPQRLVVSLDPNMKIVNGNVPACQQSQISNKPTAQAQAACPQSIVGQGVVSVNGGVLNGQVTLFSGGASTLWAQVDVSNGAIVLTLNTAITKGRILTITGIPNTPGTILDSTTISLNKRKTGKKSFYLMARCKKKSWKITESTSWYSGETLSGTATVKCKQKKKKK
jgi:hypothetical protein